MSGDNYAELLLPTGTLKVGFDRREGVMVTYEPDMAKDANCEHEISDGKVFVRFPIGSRPPRVFEEITQNGHTFEVQGTRVTQTGKVQLKNEQGVWEDWADA